MDAIDFYKELYPDSFTGKKMIEPLVGYTLNEVRIRPVHSRISPHEVDLSCKIGPVELNFALLSAAMDTVSGSELGKALSEIGACCIIYRDKRSETQLKMAKDVLDHKPFLIAEPKCVYLDDPLEYVKDILEEYDYSTIPVINRKGILKGVLFTRDIVFKDKTQEKASKWMVPLDELKVESVSTSLNIIQDRLLNEQECSVLPIVDEDKKLKGIYFMIDFFQANLSTFNDKSLVGVAVGVQEEDLDRVREAIKMGVGVIVIDSSHGNCSPVIEQAKKIVKIVDGRAAVIAGNITDIDGYLRLAQEARVDGVKAGIGSGSICTTSQSTGAGFPMFTLIRELAHTRNYLLSQGKHAPLIIPDGGISGPGEMVVAIAAGGHICMAGEWLVAAKESISSQQSNVFSGYVYYRGMASKKAIEKRLSERYGRQKKAPEGIEGLVPLRGPLKKWIGEDIELIQGGFSHVGAGNIKEIHKICKNPMVFVRFTSAGQKQIETRVETL